MFLRLCYMQVKGGSPPTSTMLERFQCSWPLLVVVQKYTHMLFCLPRSPADSLLGLVTSGPHGCASAELRRFFFNVRHRNHEEGELVFINAGSIFVQVSVEHLRPETGLTK